MPNINQAYSWAVNTCNAPNVGYSQAYRNQQTVGGITYYDCSSFIWYSLIAGGFPCVEANNGSTWPFVTYTMGPILLKMGFQKVDVNGQWLPGDVAVSYTHTEMVYNGGLASGVCMGAHTNNAPLANQVSIGSSGGDPNYVSTPARFPDLYRFGEGGASGYGYSLPVIAALCGNSWRESNINPGLEEKGNGIGFGLFQWSFERRTALENWLKENGYELTSPEGQLQYLIIEDEWQGSFGGISSLQEFFTSTSTDVPMLVEAFMKCWERPAESDPSQRVAWAKQCQDYILAHANDTSITAWVISNEYLTEAEILNNAVMMYRYLSSGGGGGGTFRRENSLPVYMMILRHPYLF